MINQCSTPQELADRSMELLGNPMIVFDVNMHVVAITACDVQEPEYIHLFAHHYPPLDFTKESGWHGNI